MNEQINIFDSYGIDFADPFTQNDEVNSFSLWWFQFLLKLWYNCIVF